MLMSNFMSVPCPCDFHSFLSFVVTAYKSLPGHHPMSAAKAYLFRMRIHSMVGHDLLRYSVRTFASRTSRLCPTNILHVGVGARAAFKAFRRHTTRPLRAHR